eukprot:955792-Pleurochrysis_carterae.AAC.1
MCACTQLTPACLLVEYERPSHRVEGVCRMCLRLKRALVKFCVKREACGSPFQLLPRRSRVPKFAFVRCRAGAHTPDVDIQLLNGVDHYPLQIFSLFLRAFSPRVFPLLSEYLLDLPPHGLVPFWGGNVKEPPCNRRPGSSHPQRYAKAQSATLPTYPCAMHSSLTDPLDTLPADTLPAA